VINIYSTDIFQKLEDQEAHTSLGIPKMNLIIGIAGFAGSIISNFTISYFSRRGVLIGGHFFMMVFHFLIFLFIIYKEMNMMLVSMALFDLTF